MVEELQSRQLPIIVDEMSATPCELLEASLEDFLAPAPKTTIDKALGDLLAHDKNVKKDPEHVETPSSGSHRLDRLKTLHWHKFLYPGNHLVYFPLQTRESDLLDDGTDILHAPNRSWKYRLWMGGSIHFVGAPKLSGQAYRLALVERIAQVKVRDSKILVQIERVVVRADKRGIGPKSNTSPDQVSNSEELSREHGRRLRNLAFPDTAATRAVSTKPDLTNIPYVREFRWLCFMKEKPDMSSQRKIPPPSVDVLERHTMTPTPALLFRFSALTANAHAIHLDAEYSKQQYGLRERLVHGPLTLVLMLTIARRALMRLKADGGTYYIVSSIDYKNHAPLYVNEPLTIVCSQPQQPLEADSSDDSPTTLAETMEIWIQRPHDDGSGEATVCVKATATLARTDPAVSQKKAERRLMLKEAAKTSATLSKGDLKRNPNKLVHKASGSYTRRKNRDGATENDAMVRKVWERGGKPVEEEK